MTIPKHLKDRIDHVIAYVDGASNDWFRIKMEIINTFPLKDRSKFSRRHKSTKKHILNSFDKEVIAYWEKETGIKLWVDPEKLHPEDWVQKPRGWKLIEINKQRQKEKEKKRQKK